MKTFIQRPAGSSQMIIHLLNFVIFLNLLAIAKEFHIYVTLILQSTEVH